MAWLSNHQPRHGELKQLAACVGISPRTLRAWRAQGECCPRRAGRPGHAGAECARADALVRAAFERLAAGHDGWRSVQAALVRDGQPVATRLIQRIVHDLKTDRARRVAQRLAENRVHVEVLARDALWGCDATLVAREAGEPLTSVVVRETFVPRTLSLSLGGEPDAADLERQLELTASARGGWPLVLMLDNGGANRAERLQRRLREERVIVLWNVPHTPQHNARTERGIGELKRASGLDDVLRERVETTEGPVSSWEPGASRTRSDVLVRLIEAWVGLDRDHARESLGGLTPDELDRIAPRADACVRRARFYEDVCAELRRVRATHVLDRERRRAEREAIWCALERNGLVTRTRGGGAVTAFKAEGVS